MKFETMQAEIQAKKEWLLEANAILQDLEQRWDDKDAQRNVENLKKHLPIINEAYDKRDLQGFQYIISDYLEQLSGLTPDQAIEIGRRLREKSGIGLKTVQKAIKKKVQEILRRGKVETADEYRLLQSRMDEISGDSAKKSELDQIVQFLSAVERVLED